MELFELLARQLSLPFKGISRTFFILGRRLTKHSLNFAAALPKMNSAGRA